MNYRVFVMAILISAVPLFLDAKSLQKEPEDSAASPKSIYERFAVIENMDSQPTSKLSQEQKLEGPTEFYVKSQFRNSQTRAPASKAPQD